MKAYLLTVVAAISLFASSCVLANPYNDNANTMDNGDSNGLVQGSNNIEGQDVPPSDDRANSVLDAGVTRDGETMGEED